MKVKDNIVYSCVAEPTEKYLIQAYIWAKSLIENSLVRPDRIVVNIVNRNHFANFSMLQGLGIEVISVDPFGDEQYCNKANQIDNLLKYPADYYVLMDADMFVCNPVDWELFLKKDAIAGKVVDLANPEITVLDELYMQASFISRPPISKADIDNSRSTYKANLNGGLYIIPSKYLRRIDNSWKKWILWILDHPTILDQARRLHHTDQVAFSMAITELDIEIQTLSREYNFPCHLYINEDTTPIVLHYHHLLSKDGISNMNPHLNHYTELLDFSNKKISKWIEDSNIQIS